MGKRSATDAGIDPNNIIKTPRTTGPQLPPDRGDTTPGTAAGRPGWYDSIDAALHALYQKHGKGSELNKCCYCGKDQGSLTLQKDHLTPYTSIALQVDTFDKMQAVTSDIRNLAYAGPAGGPCGCNQSKGDRSLIAWLGQIGVSWADFKKRIPWAAWQHTTAYNTANITTGELGAHSSYDTWILNTFGSTNLRIRPYVSGELCAVTWNGSIAGPISCATRIINTVNSASAGLLAIDDLRRVTTDANAPDHQKLSRHGNAQKQSKIREILGHLTIA